MWVARNKDGWLVLFNSKPIRGDEFWYTDSRDDDSMPIDSSLVPDLKWEDEPIEVEIVAKF